jgi:hypothetical protein
VLAVDRDQPPIRALEHDEHARVDAPAADAEDRGEAQHGDRLAAEPHDADDVRRRLRDRRHRRERHRRAQVLERDRVDLLADREHRGGEPLLLGLDLDGAVREVGRPRAEPRLLGLVRRRPAPPRQELHARPRSRARNVCAIVV